MQKLELYGKLIISVPTDITRKEEYVILIHDQTYQGTFGLILNQSISKLDIYKFLNQLQIPASADNLDVDILYGGPQEINRGSVLHSNDFLSQTTIPISSNLYLTEKLNVLQHIATGQGPEKAIVLLGHIFWGSGKLEEEIRENRWLIVPPKSKLIFETKRDSIWSESVSSLGLKPEILMNNTGNA